MNIRGLGFTPYTNEGSKSVTNCTSIPHGEGSWWWFTLFRTIKVRMSCCSGHRKGQTEKWSPSDDRVASARREDLPSGAVWCCWHFTFGIRAITEALCNPYLTMFFFFPPSQYRCISNGAMPSSLTRRMISLQEKLIIIPQGKLYNTSCLKFVTMLSNVTLRF